MVKLDKLYKGGVMDKPQKEKTCKCCKLVKTLTDYKISYKNKDGRANRCRACDKEYEKSKESVQPSSEFFQHDKYYSF